ncbi:hypothetical protein ACF2G4_01020 [Pantoea sp. C3]|uniref:hypothetical protein n=1 Tax=Pantoea phytostimulans TaxID=2769024 RepID=UPI0038F6903E
MFEEDLKLISIGKADLTLPPENADFEEKLYHSFSILMSKYLLSCLLDRGINLPPAKIVQRVISSGKPYLTLTNIKAEVSREFKFKEGFYNRVMSSHKIKLKKNSSLAVIKVSLSLNHETDQHPQIYCDNLRNSLGLFFNKLRGRVALNRVHGYFWVMLKKENSNLPFIHVCFYIDHAVFNSKVGAEIQDLWMGCTNSQGEVRHFTFNEFYGNYSLMNDAGNGGGYKSLVRMKDVPNERVFAILSDYSESYSNDLCKLEVDVGEKKFSKYVYALASEIYIYSKGMQGFYETIDEIMQCYGKPRMDKNGKLSSDKKKIRRVRAFGLSISKSK